MGKSKRGKLHQLARVKRPSVDKYSSQRVGIDRVGQRLVQLRTGFDRRPLIRATLQAWNAPPAEPGHGLLYESTNRLPADILISTTSARFVAPPCSASACQRASPSGASPMISEPRPTRAFDIIAVDMAPSPGLGPGPAKWS